MRHVKNVIGFPLAIALAGWSALGIANVAFADDPTPTTPAPGAEGANGRHHNPAWAACKQKAEGQKLDHDARHAFMKDCLKSSDKSPQPPAT
ncbi:MAG: PsiF family protein [Steroidobacteraceae bacterium]|jgi:hypothetical protein